MPDAKYGEELCAWVKLVDGETATDEDIRDFCQGQIAHQKIPRYVKFVDDFPMTVTGKIQKFAMREAMIAGAGSGGREDGLGGCRFVCDQLRPTFPRRFPQGEHCWLDICSILLRDSMDRV